MLTWTDMKNKFQKLSGDKSAAGLLVAEEDMNEGASVFMNELGRKFSREYLYTDLVSGKQYYQFSAVMLRLSEVKCLNGNSYYTPELVGSEHEWNRLNTTAVTGSVPTHYFIRGNNEVGFFPIPLADVENGISVSHEPEHVELTQDDFTSGTVTVTVGQQEVNHSDNGFLPQMVGRWLQITDGTDGKWYRISQYMSPGVIKLENYFEGISGLNRSFRIGEVSKLPPAYQSAPVDYALDLYYQSQNDQRTAGAYSARFERKLKQARKKYARSTSRMGVKRGRTRDPKWIDLTPPVSYP